MHISNCFANTIEERDSARSTRRKYARPKNDLRGRAVLGLRISAFEEVETLFCGDEQAVVEDASVLAVLPDHDFHFATFFRAPPRTLTAGAQSAHSTSSIPAAVDP